MITREAVLQAIYGARSTPIYPYWAECAADRVMALLAADDDRTIKPMDLGV